MFFFPKSRINENGGNPGSAQEKLLFVSLPTGFGKSVIFQALPIVFDSYTGKSGHTVIVVSPLLSLIKDQCERLRHIGISSISLSDVNTQEEIHLVESGCYSVIYATAEPLLKNERWRRMLSSDLFFCFLVFHPSLVAFNAYCNL